MGSLPNRRFKPRSRIVGEDIKTFELTKIDIAETLIRTAVRLFFQDEHPVPIYQLASSAREILTTVGEKVGVETVLHAIAKKRNVPLKTLVGEAHKFAGRFKHANRNPTEKIQFRETDVDWVLLLACHDFGRVTGGMPVEAQVFEAWAHLVFWERSALATAADPATCHKRVSRRAYSKPRKAKEDWTGDLRTRRK